MSRRVNRYSAGASAVLPNLLFLLACAAVVAVLFWDASAMALVASQPALDYWSHLAVLEQWLQNPDALAEPLVGGTVLSPLFVPLFWLLAGAGRILGLDAIQLLTSAGVVNFVLLAAGLKLFLGDYFRHPWAAFIGLVVLFCGWGLTGSGPGIYQLRNFLQVAGDPSTFAFALSLIAFWATMRVLRSEAIVNVWSAALLLLVALTFLSHPLTGFFCVMGCGLLAVTEFSTSFWARLAVFVIAAAGLAVAELWPYFSVWKLVLGLTHAGFEGWSADALLGAALEQDAAGRWAPLLYDPSSLFAVLGVSLVGLVLIVGLLQRGEQPFIVYGALLMLLPYVLNLVVDVPLTHRFVLFAAFFMQLALVWGWLKIISFWNILPRALPATPMLLLSLAAGVAMVGGNYWLLQQQQQGRSFNAQTLQLQNNPAFAGSVSVPEVYGKLLAPVADDAVILATPAAGWPVPAFQGKVVALLNPNSLLPDMTDRQTLTKEFFFGSPADLERVATIQRFGVSYVLVDTSDNATQADLLLPWLQNYGQPVAEQGDYRMYKLAAALHTIRLPEPEAADSEAEAEALAASEPGIGAESGQDVSASAARRRAVNAAPQSKPEDGAPPSFGTPIPEPVLDPKRHGG